MRTLKIITYNVNGLRAAIRKGFIPWLSAANADLVCLQEVKALPKEVPVAHFEELGYRCLFAPAERRGYSGVAIFSRLPIAKHVLGCGHSLYDSEGRILRVVIGELCLVSVYMPSGSSADARQAFKMSFLADFMPWVQQLQATHHKLIICGDFNICHQPIDIHDPVRNKNSSGFLPEERNWLTRFLSEARFTDAFRHLHPDARHAYSWWSFRSNARQRNLGWRIDYHMISNTLAPQLQSCMMLSEAHHSDHCPVYLKLKI